MKKKVTPIQKKSSSSAKAVSPDAMMMLLEPRVLFDGAMVATARELGGEDVPDLIVDNDDAGSDGTRLAWQPILDQFSNVGGSLVILDTGVAGWEQLLSATREKMEVVLLDPKDNGVARITEILAGRKNLESLTIVSHGRAGEVLLGNSRLTLDTLEAQSGSLAKWGSALAEKGDILIYGCDVGAGETGRAFAETLANLTGRDVALSADATGASGLGGDWDLEVRQGDIEAPLPFRLTALDSFHGLLEAPIAIPGVYDHGITLDGTDDRVDIHDSISATPVYPLSTAQGTVTLWFKIQEGLPAGSGKLGMIFANTLSNKHAVQLHVENNTATQDVWSFYGGMDFYNPTSIGQARAGQWHHAALTWRTDGTGDIYLDGQNVKHYNNIPAYAGPPAVAAHGLYDLSTAGGINNRLSIGTYADYQGLTTYNFPGSVAELRIWNTGLSTTAATALTWIRSDMVTASLTGAEAGLTSYFPLNDGVTNTSDTVATDTKGGIDGDLLPGGQPQWITRPTEGSAGVTVSLGGSDADANPIGYATLATIPNAATEGALYRPDATGVPTGLPLTAGTQITTASDAARKVVFVPVADFDGTATWTFTVNDGTANSVSPATVSITMAPVQDAPVLTAIAPSLTSITEDATTNSGQTVASFVGASITDVDTSPAPVEGIAVTTLNSGSGTWQYDTGSGWQAVGTVSGTSALLLRATDSIRFVPGGANAESVGFTYRAWDQTSGATGTKVSVASNGGATAFSTSTDTASLTVTAINDAPVLTAIAPALTTITENDTTNTGQTIASFVGASISDVDAAATQGIAITGWSAGYGTWQYDTGGGWLAVGAVADASALLLRSTDSIRYIPDAIHDENVTLTYRAWDQTSGATGTKVNVATNGGTTAFSTSTDTASLTVTAVNDAPVLTAIAPALTAITEDATTNSGQTVASFVGASITDVDTSPAPVEGIAITTLNSGSGTWQYDTGSGWQAVGTVSGTSSLLLRATDSIRFVPGGANAESVGFTYRAWDQTSGATGTKVSVASNGGATAFSTSTDTASLTVTAINDAPVLTAIAPTLTTITENDTTNTGQTIASFVGASISDVDAAATQGIAITGWSAGYGTWQYNTGGGWLAVGAVADASALLLRSTDSIRYIPDAIHGEGVTLTYRAWDQTSGATGTKVNVATNGGTTAFSTTTDTASLTVTEVNDQPQLTIGTGDQLVFDGNNDTVHSPTFVFPTTAFTIELWWKPVANLNSASARQDLLFSDTATGRPHISFNKNGGGEVGIFTKIGGPSYDTAVSTTTTWSAGRWYHLAFSFDGANTRVYVNGQLERQVAQPGVHDAQTGFYLGARSNLVNDMSGGLADLRIWSTTRTQTNILDNMSRLLVGTEPGLAGYWPMSEGSGATVTDRTGADLGTLSGPTWSSTDSVWGMEEKDIAIPGLVITDVDTAANSTVTLTVASGTLTVDTGVAGGVGAGGVTGNGTATVTLVGTLAQLNATLAGTNALVYRGNTNFYGADSLTIGVTDNAGGSTSGTVAITVYNIYDPLAVTAGGALVFTEGNAATGADAAVSILNDDGGNLTGAQVAFTAGYVPGQDVLSFTNTGAITGSWNAGTGILTLTGTTSSANYQTALRSIAFNNAGGDNPTAGVRTLSWTVTNALGTSPASLSTVTVQAVNDRPVMTAGATLNYQENDAATVVDATLTATDPDNTTLQGATVVISNNYVVGEDRLVFVNQSGISGSWDAATGTLTLTGPATLANYQTALRSVRYVNDNGNTPQSSTRTVDFSVTDGVLASVVVQSNVVVTAVNDAPVVTAPGSGTVNEDQVLALAGVSIADADVAAGTMQLALGVNNGVVTLGSTAGLTFSAGADGSGSMTFTGTVAAINTALTGLTYQPNGNYFGADSMTIVANDLGGTGSGGARSTSVTLGITVNPVQDTPVAGNDSDIATEDVPQIIFLTVDLLANDWDVDGDILTLSTFTNPSQGTLVNNGDGTLTYLSNLNYHGPDSFTYTVDDGHGNTDQGLVTIVVNPVLDGLQAVNDTATTTEETAVTVSVLGNDRDPDFLPNGINPLLAVIGFTNPAHGQVIDLGGGQFTYTPDGNYSGVDSFTYTLNTGDARIDTGTVTITVNGVNDSPVVAVNTGAAVVEGASVTVTPTFLQLTDPEQAAPLVTLTLVNAPVNGNLELNGVVLTAGQTWTEDDIDNNRLVYRHGGSETLADGFSFTAADGVGGALLQTNFGITVIPVNDDPSLVQGVLVASEGGDSTVGGGHLAATDAEEGASALVYVMDSLPGHGSLLFNGTALALAGSFTQADIDAGRLVYRHDGGESASDSFDFHINDSQGGSVATTTLTITITPVNDAPVMTLPGGQTVNEDQSLDIAGVVLADSDLGAAVAQVTASVTHGVLTLSSTTGVTFISGSNGASAWTLSGTLVDLNTALAHIGYQGQADYNGSDQLVLTMDDGGATGASGPLVAAGTVAITVQPVNDTPSLGVDMFATAEDTPLTLTIATDLLLNDIDPDGGSLVFSSFTQPTQGAVVLSGATLVYTPVASYNGIDTLTYTVVNSRGESAVGVVNIVVAPTVDALTPGDDSVTVLEDGSVVTGNLLANDRDPDFLPDGINPALAIVGFTPTVFGTLTYLGGGQFNYIPDADFNGVESFSYTLNAGDVRTGVATVTITVTPVNDDPTMAVNTGLALNEGGQVIVTDAMLDAQDLEQTASQLQYILTTAPAHGTLTLSGVALPAGALFSQDDIDNHRVIYGHDGGETVSDPFVVGLTDGVGGFLLNQTVTVTVTGVNDTPQLSVNAGLTVAEGASAILQAAFLTMTDAESPNNAITYSLTTIPAHGQLRLNGTTLAVGQTFTQADLAAAKVDYLHDGSDTLADGFKFTVADGQGGSFAETFFNITVTAVNDPLVITAGGGWVWTEGDAPVLANATLSITDADGTNLTGAKVAIVSGFVAGEDSLAFADTAAITGSWDASTGILSLSGLAAIADYQAALRSVIYNNAGGDNPTAGVRTLEWTATDSFETSPVSQSTITVQPVNDRPVMTATATLDYQENDPATVIDATLTVVDADSLWLQGATVVIANNHVTGEDRLVFVNQAGISGSWDGATGTLILSGPATQANYQTALRSVRYINDNGSTPQASTRQVRFSVDDGTLSSLPVLVDVGVTAVNDAPAISPHGPVAVNEDQTLALAGFVVTDEDVGGGTLQLAMAVHEGIIALGTTAGLSVVSGANGSALVTFSGTLAAINTALGSLTYQPNGNYFGPDSLTLVINDLGGTGSGGARSHSVTLGITVTPVQDAPVAGADFDTATEDVPQIVFVATELLANDVDWDGDLLTLASFTSPAHGTLVDNGNGTLTYLSDLNYHGLDSFTYTVDDGYGNTDQGVVTIVVNPIPDGLDAGNDTATTTEETLVTFSVLGNDRDPDFLPNGQNPALAIIGFTSPAHGQAVYLGSGQFSYTPDADYFGIDTLTYTLNAGDARIDTGTVTITINGVNDSPTVAVNTGAAVVEGASVTITPIFLQVTDPEQPGSQVTLTLVNMPVHGLMERNGVALSAGQTVTQDDVQNNLLIYRHDGSETLTDSFSFTAADGVGGTLLETSFLIQVLPHNDNPLLVQGGLTVDEGGDATLSAAQLAATDTEGGAASLTYLLESLPGQGNLTLNGTALGLGSGFTQADIDAGRVGYHHNGSETVSDSFSFHIDDGSGGTVATTVQTITVTAVNDAPVWTLPGGQTVNEDQNLDITGVSIADPDLGFSVVQVTLSVTHGTLNLPTTTGIVAIAGGNGTESWTLAGSLANVNTALAHITYRGHADYHGSDQLVLVATDGGASGMGGARIAVGGVTVTVQPVNDQPSAGSDAFATGEETAITLGMATDLLANDTDPDGGALTLTSWTQPAHGTVVQVGTTLVYTPAAQYNGLDQFTYTIVNSNSGSATGTVNIVVASEPDTLSPGDDQVAVVEDGSVTTGNLLANDRDPDFLPDGVNPALAIIGFSPTVSGSLVYLGGGRFTYTPDANFNGLDFFSYTFNAGDLRTDQAWVVITVTPDNDSPTLVLNTGFTLAEGGQVTLTNLMLQAQDLEQSASQINYLLASAPAHGTLTRNGVVLTTGSSFSQGDIDNHLVTYTHDGGETQSDPFTVSIADGVGGFLLNQSVSVTVSPVNDDPMVLVNAGLTVAEGGSTVLATSSLAMTDAESPGNAITYSLTTIPAHGQLRLHGTALTAGQTFTQADLVAAAVDYLHDGSDTLADSFKFTVADGQGGSFAETSFAIVVAAVNDPLVVTAGGGRVWTEGDAPVLANTTLSLADNDGMTLTSARVAITTGFSFGEDVLFCTSTSAITGAWNGTVGILTLSGTASLADYQTALRSVTYTNLGGDNPTAGVRTLAWSGTDTFETSPLSLSTITVQVENDRPIMTAGATGFYQEGAAATIVDAGITVADNDSASLQGATVVLSGNFTVGEDRLVFVDQSGIVGSWNGATGTLTLSGAASVAQYQTALRSVRYVNDNGDTPQSGTRQIQWGVNDGTLASLPVVSSMTVTAVNDAPVITLPAPKAVDEDQISPLTGIVVTDVDAGTGTMQLAMAVNHGIINLGTTTDLVVVSGANGSASMTVTGSLVALGNALNTLTYRPASDYFGTDSLAIVANDLGGSGSGGIKTTAVSLGITVTNVQDPPVATIDAAMAMEDVPKVIDVAGDLLSNDWDGDGDSLSVVATGSPSHGSLVDNGNGTLTYLSSENYHGLDSFTYTVGDGHGNTAQAVVTIVVNPIFDSLVAVDDGATVLEDGVGNFSVLANDRDPDFSLDSQNPVLAVIGFTKPAHGQAIYLGNGQFVYTPDGDYFGTDSFTYTLNDGNVRVDTGVVTVTITNVNDAPVVAVNTSAEVTEGGTVVVSSALLRLTDLEQPADAITLTLVAVPAHGYLKLNGTTLFSGQSLTQDDIQHDRLVYHHDGSETLVDQWSFTAADGVGGSLLETTFRIKITPADDGPVLVGGVLSLDEGGQATVGNGNLAATDPEGVATVFSYTVGTLPLHGSLLLLGNVLGVGGTFTQADIAAGRLVYRHDGSETVSDSSSFSVSDGQGGGAATASLTIRINPVNDAPSWKLPGAQTASEDQDLAITGISLADSDLGPRVIHVTLSAAHGTLSFSPPAAVVSDSGGNGTESWSFSGTLANINATLAHIVYRGHSDFHGADQLVLLANDSGALGYGGTKIAVDGLAIVVQPMVDNPHAGADVFYTAKNTPLTLTVATDLLANDSDSDSLPFSLSQVGQPAHGTAVLSGTHLVYTPTASFSGLDQLTYTIVNAQGGSATALVSIVVAPQAGTLDPGDDHVSVSEDGSLTTGNLLANDRDPNYQPDGRNPALTLLGFTPAAHGTLRYLGGGQMRYTPAADFNGLDFFSYTLGVGDQRMDEAWVVVTVTSSNDNPVMVGNTGFTSSEGGQVTLTGGILKARDLEQSSSQVRFILTAAPAHGTIAISGKALTTGSFFSQDDIDNHRVVYTHDGSESQSDPFTVSVTDGVGGFLLDQTVAVTVTPVNDSPLLVANIGLTVLEGGSAVLTPTSLQVTDAESPDQSLVYTLVTIPVHGQLRLDGVVLGVGQTTTQADLAASKVVYSHDGSDTLTDGFSWTVQDGQGGEITKTSSAIVVTAVNDPLVVTAGGGQVWTEGDAPVLADATLAITDNDGMTLTSAQVAISAGFRLGEDVLFCASTSAITGSWNASTGILSLSGTASLADYQAALRSVTYTNLGGDNPTAGVRTLAWSGTDSVETSSLSFSTVTVQAINDRPVMTAGATLSYVENDSAAIVDATLTVADPDSAGLQGATVTISSHYVTGEDRLVFVDQSGISGSWDGGTGILTLSGPATVAQYQAALRSVRYVNDNGDNLQPSTRQVQFSVDDGKLASVSVYSTITVTPSNAPPITPPSEEPVPVVPVNEAPILTAPAGVTVLEDVTTPVSGLSVSDPDIGPSPVLVRLAVEHGHLSVAKVPGLTFADGANETASMTLVGSIDVVNQALAGLRYQGVKNFFGDDILRVYVSDGYQGGTALVGTASTTVSIRVTPVDDIPLPGMDTIVVPGNDPSASKEPVVIDVLAGLLGNDFEVDGDVLQSVNFTQPMFGVLENLGGGKLSYVPNDSYKGFDQFTYTMTDPSGNYDFTTVVIINPIQDALSAGDDALDLFEDEPTRTSAVLGNDRDPDYSVNGGSNPALEIIAFTQGRHGTVAYVGNHAFLYMPNRNYHGLDQFTYTLNAGDRRIDVATVHVVVKPVNDQPALAINAGLALVRGDSAVIGSNRLKVTDVDNTEKELVYRLESLPGSGRLFLSGVELSTGARFTQADVDKGLLLYRNNPIGPISDRFRFSVEDGAGGFLVITDFVIRVDSSGDAPEIIPPVVQPPVVEPLVVGPPKNLPTMIVFPVVAPPVVGVNPGPLFEPSKQNQFFQEFSVFSSTSQQQGGGEVPWWENLGQRPMDVAPSPAPSGSVGLLGMDVEYSTSPILTVVRAHERSIALDASGTPLLTAVMNASPGVEEGGVVTPVLNAVKRAGRSVAPGASITPVLSAVVASRPEGIAVQLGSPLPEQGPARGFFMPGFSFMPWIPGERPEADAVKGTGGAGENEGQRIEMNGNDSLLPPGDVFLETTHPVPQPAPKPVMRHMRMELSEEFNQLAVRKFRDEERLRMAFV